MPGLLTQPEFATIAIRELHPTFAAEVDGVNFQDLSDQQFTEVVAALAKVIPSTELKPTG